MNAQILLCVVLTLLAYGAFRALYLRFTHPLLNIVILSAAAIIGVLLWFDIPYESYAQAKEYMTLLLGPATVSLAAPLYSHRRLLQKNAGKIAGCVALGAALAMGSAAAITALGGAPRDVVMSIMPKGVSIPFAVPLASMYGGTPALTAAFVVATGTLGSLIGAWFLTRVRISDPVARGLALGTVSHAQGTATAFLEGQKQGAMAGLAMILAGLFTAGMAPLLVFLF
jgi:predicted murein hydrolase (TIGR00659 family)